MEYTVKVSTDQSHGVLILYLQNKMLLCTNTQYVCETLISCYLVASDWLAMDLSVVLFGFSNLVSEPNVFQLMNVLANV